MKWYNEGIKKHDKIFKEYLEIKYNWTEKDQEDWHTYKPARNKQLQKEFNIVSELNIKKEKIKYDCGEPNDYTYLIEVEKKYQLLLKKEGGNNE